MKKRRQNSKNHSGSGKGNDDGNMEPVTSAEGLEPAPPGRFISGLLSTIGINTNHINEVGSGSKGGGGGGGSDGDSREGDGGGREGGSGRESGGGREGGGSREVGGGREVGGSRREGDGGGRDVSGGRESGGHRNGPGGGIGGGMPAMAHRPHIVDNGHPRHILRSHVTVSQYLDDVEYWKKEALRQNKRAQDSEKAHADDYDQLDEQIAKLESDIASLVKKHEHEKQQLEGEHKLQVAAQVAACEDRHREALEKQHAENERMLDEIIDSHDAELEVYNAKVRALASDLISQSDDFRPATDQSLSMKLLDLRNRIKNITLPSNLQIRSAALPVLPGPGSAAGRESDSDTVNATGTLQLPAELDPTGFVARHGSREIQYILRSLVWKALVEAFFSSPFGFGFLGSRANGSAGRQLLLDIHHCWSRLYSGSQHLYRGDELGVYSHDPYANKMRSALFQSFLPAVYPEKASRNKNVNGSHQDLHQDLGLNGVSSGSDLGVAMLYRQHCDSVVAKIRQLLDRITNNNTRLDALEAVSTIVNLAAELGLECGVQRAQIWLVVPKPNEIVTVGAEYADCLGGGSGDGDRDGGRDVQVDLVVSPGIVRIGDGRYDMTVRKALVPCEVFPLMEDGS